MDENLPKTRKMFAALAEIVEERNYQTARWTPEHDKEHSPAEWLAILAVYIGKAAMECPPYTTSPKKMAAFRKRVRQVGAICAAILEATGRE